MTDKTIEHVISGNETIKNFYFALNAFLKV